MGRGSFFVVVIGGGVGGVGGGGGHHRLRIKSDDCSVLLRGGMYR